MNAENITEFINFVNYVIKTALPDLETNLYISVGTDITHTFHFNSCQKYKS